MTYSALFKQRFALKKYITVIKLKIINMRMYILDFPGQCNIVVYDTYDFLNILYIRLYCTDTANYEILKKV